MKTGLSEAGFFLKILIPPKPSTDNILSFLILFLEIPPKGKILILLAKHK